MDRLVCYVVDELGAAPRTMLRDGVSHVDWNMFQGRVRPLPEEDAVSVVANHPGAFAYCHEATGSEPAAAHTETFYPVGAEPVLVVVEDQITAAALAAKKAPGKAGKKEG